MLQPGSSRPSCGTCWQQTLVTGNNSPDVGELHRQQASVLTKPPAASKLGLILASMCTIASRVDWLRYSSVCCRIRRVFTATLLPRVASQRGIIAHLQHDPSLQLSSTEYDDARQKYTEAMHTLGYQADLAYNTALCYFKDKQYVASLKHVGESRKRSFE